MTDDAVDAEGACPFCGHEEYWEPCTHMVLDWAWDSWMEGGGVGDGWSAGSGALRTLEELEDACEALFLKVSKDDPEDLETRVAEVKRILLPEAAGWWPEVERTLMEQDELPGEREFLREFSTPIVNAIASLVPDVVRTSDIIGGMTSADHEFIWSEAPEAAAEIARRITLIAASIRAATDEVSGGTRSRGTAHDHSL